MNPITSRHRHSKRRSPAWRAALALGFVSAALWLAACSPPEAGDLSTAAPLQPTEPTRDDEGEAPGAASPTPAPMTAATPAIVIEPEFPAPTDTPDLPGMNIPLEELAILSPGPGSQVVDPVQLAGFGGPSQFDRVQVRLYGEDGRLISKGWSYLYVMPGNAGNFYAKLPFTSPLVAEIGWLEVRSFGERYGQLRHVSSQQVMLLSTGNPRIYPAMRGAEKLTIFQPREESIVEGGSITVFGAGWVDDKRPLTVQLIDSTDSVLASVETWIDSPEPGQLGPFQTTLEYEIPYPRWARVAVFERAEGIPVIIHYASVEVWLKP